ncbi:epoxide hydrolase family protein [Dyadobacter fermentans]|uniref:epoxide hydrolase family protein n=1 Tax=Dyadobacter fermentans TaxID=94254 RepID=UPI001CBA8506|nr:epoxide hydrolase family protein [Dyadobacter fermentans]MBZ1360413.1 epoxide hydrolase [Dyadobacter fermentans]
MHSTSESSLERYSFELSFSERELRELRRRLIAINWPGDSDNADWRYGVNQSYLKELVNYWLTDFDWRAVEQQINAYSHYRVPIDGVPIHFLYKKGIGNKTIPIILTHGWPWSFWDMQKVIGQLTDPAAYGFSSDDAFDVIVPSLPGYGFSNPAPAGINFWRTADLWQKLMTEILGYGRYAASGGDWGALVTSQLGHKYARSLYGIHLMHTMALDQFNNDRPWDVLASHKVAENTSPEIRRQSLDRMKVFASHYAVHILDPQTIAYGLQDSPTGLLAWLLERWRSWAQLENQDLESVFSREHMITNAMFYYMTGTVASSMRFYADSVRYPWQPSHAGLPVVQAPTGITFLGGENPAGVSTTQRIEAFKNGPKAGWYNLHYMEAHQKGGHFGYYENPQAVSSDIRKTFAGLRD